MTARNGDVNLDIRFLFVTKMSFYLSCLPDIYSLHLRILTFFAPILFILVSPGEIQDPWFYSVFLKHHNGRFVPNKDEEADEIDEAVVINTATLVLRR